MKYTPTWLGSEIHPIIGNGSINGVYDMSKSLSIWIEFARKTTYGRGFWTLSFPMDNFLDEVPGMVAFYDEEMNVLKTDLVYARNNRITVVPHVPSLQSGNKMFVGFGDVVGDLDDL
jgi:hypothetical protein